MPKKRPRASYFNSNKDINRIKVVLVDKKKTNKWLAEQLGKDQTTISKWCTNTSQPDIESLMKIAKLLGVELAELVRFEQIHTNEIDKNIEE
ncbi:MAG: helix-turn-helix transcriptional regulator [Alloprevotella sp.]|nr:helix-turn-helix transcriptional regulator [Alloprevotella sp.]